MGRPDSNVYNVYRVLSILLNPPQVGNRSEGAVRPLAVVSGATAIPVGFIEVPEELAGSVCRRRHSESRAPKAGLPPMGRLKRISVPASIGMTFSYFESTWHRVLRCPPK